MNEDKYDKDTVRTSSKQPSNGMTSKVVAIGILIIIVGIGGFFGGISYEKGHNQTKATSTTAQFGGGGAGGFSGGRRGNFGGGIGTVSAISSSSITINNTRTNAAQTFSITSSTAITDNGSTVAYSDIQSGDTVFVRTSGSGSTTATQITVNPSFGGGPGGDTPESQ